VSLIIPSHVGPLKRHEKALEDRQSLVQELAGRHGIEGYDQYPLSSEKIEVFIDQLAEMQRQHSRELEDLKVSLVFSCSINLITYFFCELARSRQSRK
jgi:hypothetical protein